MPPANPDLVDQWLAQLAADGLLPKKPAYKDHGKVSRETYHDFASYMYVLDPWEDRPYQLSPGPQANIVEDPGPSASQNAEPEQLSDPATLQWLEADAAHEIEAFIGEARRASADPATFDEAAIRKLLERFLLRTTAELGSIYLAPWAVPGRRAQLLFVLIERALPELVDLFARLPPEHREAFLTSFDLATTQWIRRAAYLETPWLWFAAGSYRLRSTWDALGYQVGDVYQWLPSIPPETLAYGATGPPFPLPPPDEAHIVAWDDRLVDVHPYGLNLVNLPASTMYFVGPTPSYYSNLTDLVREANRLLALVPPPDPASSWLSQLVDELAGNLVGPTPPGGTVVTPQAHYGFSPYPYPSINIGLQVVYRQTWTSLDPGQGELVKTIPLGPGQSEKVVVRRVEREKITREFADTSSTETERESTSKTTISSEIVEEAAKSSKWHIDQGGEGHVNIGVWGVKATTDIGYESESSSSSRDTKKRLNDASQRTTSKMRRESRLVVTTERERTFETTQTSEIRNPNEELAVTYYYYALQQQYEVRTELAAVEPVVFVAERIPNPSELTITWIQRFDWLIGQNLLDESFRDILSRVSTLDLEGLKQEIIVKETEVETLRVAVTKAQESLGKLDTLPGNVSNTYEGTLKAYQEAVRSALDLARQVQATVRDAQRLGQHIADNILYYMRAIWGSEDPDRRRMRFNAISWPTQFTRVDDSTTASADGTGTDVYGHFSPVSGSEEPLSELVDPTGPLAFAGNYGVFRLRKTALTADLTALIRQRQMEFSHQTFTVDPPIGVADLNASDAYAGEQYLVMLTGADPTTAGSYTVTRTPARDTADTDGESLAVTNGGKAIELGRAGLVITLSRTMNQNEAITVAAGALELRDPELSFLQRQRPAATLAQLADELRKANTRTLVVDTDNAYLEIDPSPLLETFKQYHRMLDVAKEFTEVQRRTGRLKSNLYADPEIDKVVVISNAAGGAGGAAASAETVG